MLYLLGITVKAISTNYVPINCLPHLYTSLASQTLEGGGKRLGTNATIPWTSARILAAPIRLQVYKLWACNHMNVT